MNRVNKLFLIFASFCRILFCCVFTACEPTNYRGLNFGKYYLENSEDVYVEIKKDHQAYLHNLDFSDFDPDEYWGECVEWTIFPHITTEEITEFMQGEREYAYFSDGILAFVIKSPFGISFEYNGANQLTFENDVYILRK